MTNSKEMTVAEKIQLMKALSKAMIIANIDRDSVGDYFKEESFRYITISEISKLGKWGTFPNNTKKNKLVFEFGYGKYKKLSNPEKFIPDIVSFNYLTAKKEKDQIRTHFVVELKVRDKIDPITDDLKHCREYIKKGTGKHDFNLAVCLILNPSKSWDSFRSYVLKLASKRKNSPADSNLLFGCLSWENEEEAAPGFLWL